jgi:hypothetical protein
MKRHSLTERARSLQIIEDEFAFPRVGSVSKVYEHTEHDDLSNHEVDVEWPPGQPVRTFRRVPVCQPAFSAAYVPNPDDIVVLTFREGDDELPMVTNYVHASADSDRAPLGFSGLKRLAAGSLYTEMSEDWARLAKKRDDDTKPTARVEIDDTSAAPVIEVTRHPAGSDTPDMGLELDLDTGEFKLGDGDGYGIVSDGSGNFTWYAKDVHWVTDESTISW